jgi:hypothetical protein
VRRSVSSISFLLVSWSGIHGLGRAKRVLKHKNVLDQGRVQLQTGVSPAQQLSRPPNDRRRQHSGDGPSLRWIKEHPQCHFIINLYKILKAKYLYSVQHSIGRRISGRKQPRRPNRTAFASPECFALRRLTVRRFRGL